jgi:Mn-dependent DtxR family transcriptional regulator
MTRRALREAALESIQLSDKHIEHLRKLFDSVDGEPASHPIDRQRVCVKNEVPVAGLAATLERAVLQEAVVQLTR